MPIVHLDIYYVAFVLLLSCSWSIISLGVSGRWERGWLHKPPLDGKLGLFVWFHMYFWYLLLIIVFVLPAETFVVIDCRGALLL